MQCRSREAAMICDATQSGNDCIVAIVVIVSYVGYIVDVTANFWRSVHVRVSFCLRVNLPHNFLLIRFVRSSTSLNSLEFVSGIHD